MNSLPHYGPWYGEEYPRAELTAEEEARMKKKMDELTNPSPERQKEIVEQFTAAMEDFERRKKLPQEEQEREMREYYEKNPIPYSPPYPPVDPVYAHLWSALLSAGIMDVQMVKENGEVGFTVHQTQTVTLEKGKFYPIRPNGGQIQQDKFFNS